MFSRATLSGRVRRWTARVRRGFRADSPYRSPNEIALRNAADSLGVTLGEYYPDDVALPDGLQDWQGDDGDPARRDAMREEMLVYIERVGSRRKQRRRARAVWIGAAG